MTAVDGCSLFDIFYQTKSPQTKQIVNLHAVRACVRLDATVSIGPSLSSATDGPHFLSN